MENQLTALQADNDRLGERLEAVEAGQELSRVEADERRAAATIERPRLKVVRVVPEAEQASPERSSAPGVDQVPSPEPEAGAERMTIQGTGEKIRAVPGARAKSGGRG